MNWWRKIEVRRTAAEMMMRVVAHLPVSPANIFIILSKKAVEASLEPAKLTLKCSHSFTEIKTFKLSLTLTEMKR
jgi:hypothetical protein